MRSYTDRNGDYLLLSAEPETNPDNEDSTAIESLPKVFSRDAFVTCRLVLKRTYHLILRLETSDAGLDAQTYRLSTFIFVRHISTCFANRAGWIQ